MRDASSDGVNGVALGKATGALCAWGVVASGPATRPGRGDEWRDPLPRRDDPFRSRTTDTER